MIAPGAGQTAALATGPTAARLAQAEIELSAHEPQLVPLLRRELPRAMDIVGRRLVGAALREGLISLDGATVRLPAPGGGTARIAVARYGFDRLEPTEPVPGDPAQLLQTLAGAAVPAVRAELADACVNLALALARRSTVEAELARAWTQGVADMVELTADLATDERTVAFERLSTEGHNLHPCGRTRLGWRVDDLLAHDLESPVTSVGFLAVRRDLHVGDEVALLSDVEADAAMAAAGLHRGRFVVSPVHPWQRRHVLRGRYADLAAEGALVPLDVELPALVTSALRTLLLPGGDPRFVKLSLDIQVTSTRRTISVASTHNGPVLSRLLPDLIADDRVLLLAEPAGAAVVVPGDPTRTRDLAAIVRGGLSGRLAPGEVVVPGAALPARDPVAGRTVVAVLADRFGRTRRLATPDAAALGFVTEYADLVLPPVLRLATAFGIGLEAHLQNCLPTFLDGVPHRIALRDLAGLRVHAPRLAQSLGSPPPLWPGSVTITDDLEVMRAKVGYTALQAHLGEIILRLVESHGLDEARAWAAVRSTVDESYGGLARRPGLTARARADHAWLTAPHTPHKALLRMRLRAATGEGGDHYVRVTNALARRKGASQRGTSEERTGPSSSDSVRRKGASQRGTSEERTGPNLSDSAGAA